MQVSRLVIYFSLVTVYSFAQSTSTFMGAKAAGMGYASSCLSDEWSLFNNVAGLARVKIPSLNGGYEARPLLQGADRMAFVATLPTKIGTGAIGVFRFGDDLYSEQNVSIGFSNQLGLASLGASIQYLQYNAIGFGTKGMLTFHVGGLATLTEKLSIGAHIQNVNQPLLSENTKERVPTRLTLGVGFKPSDNVFLTTEVLKDIDLDATYKGGLEYQPVKKFAARTGFQVHPNKVFLGIGFTSTRLILDYAYEYAFTTLGYSHQASVGYKLKSK